MKTYRLIIFAALLLTVMPLAGCSKMVPLKGTVVFSDDGTPVSNGTICFTDGKNVSRGTINADGSFEMGFVGMKDGIPPGQYTVYFFGVESPSSESGGGETMTMNVMGNMSPVNVMGKRTPWIDPRYDSPTSSDLRAEVTDKTKTMEFKVDRFDPKK
jgi:hypothetical protein